MANSLYEKCLQEIMVVVFKIFDCILFWWTQLPWFPARVSHRRNWPLRKYSLPLPANTWHMLAHLLDIWVLAFLCTCSTVHKKNSTCHWQKSISARMKSEIWIFKCTYWEKQVYDGPIDRALDSRLTGQHWDLDRNLTLTAPVKFSFMPTTGK